MTPKINLDWLFTDLKNYCIIKINSNNVIQDGLHRCAIAIHSNINIAQCIVA